MKRDHLLFLAILIAVACPALPGLGSPENISALLLLLVLLSSGTGAPVTGFAYAMLAMGGLICVSTIAGLLLIGGFYSFNPSALGSYVRIVICFQALRCADDPTTLHRWLLWLGAGASLFALLQFLSPDVVAAFTSAHYLASERSSVFLEDFSGSSIVRVIGFFENPSSVALLSIAFILLSIRAFSVGQLGRNTLMLFLVLHLAAGILSLSKVFFAGLPLVMLQLFLLRYRAAVFSTILVAIVGFVLIINSDAPQMQVIRYAFDATLNPDVALSNRYLDEALAVLDRSWALGYGLVAVDKVVINDSAYLELAYLVGKLGILVIAALSFWWLWRWRRQLPASLYLIVAIVLIAGVGTNSILGFRVDIFLTAAFALLCVAVRTPHRNKGRVTC